MLASALNALASFNNANARWAPSTSISGFVCEHCNVNTKYFDGTYLHPYCGKTCASAAAQTWSQVAQSQPLCIVCKTKPQYDDGKTAYQYCSKTCAKKASSTKPITPKVVGPVCSIPGCQKIAYTDPSGTPSTFCSMNHKKLSEEACLICKKVPKRFGHFCTRACAHIAEKTSPSLLEVPEGHLIFKDVAEQFKISWRNAAVPCPKVRCVYKIISPQSSIDKYEAYRASVEARGKFVASGHAPGNEKRRWHGTKRLCKLGDLGNTQFCTSKNCALCSIVKSNYDISLAGAGQFGRGIYTSSTSSKSNFFSKNVNFTSSLKAMILNKVVVGKGHKLTQNNTALTAPPAGYDSVLGERGGALTDDELIVYTSDAVRPSFLLMYDA